MEARSSGPRACTICAKAKAKCVPSATSLKCERYIYPPIVLTTVLILQSAYSQKVYPFGQAMFTTDPSTTTGSEAKESNKNRPVGAEAG